MVSAVGIPLLNGLVPSLRHKRMDPTPSTKRPFDKMVQWVSSGTMLLLTTLVMWCSQRPSNKTKAFALSVLVTCLGHTLTPTFVAGVLDMISDTNKYPLCADARGALPCDHFGELQRLYHEQRHVCGNAGLLSATGQMAFRCPACRQLLRDALVEIAAEVDAQLAAN